MLNRIMFALIDLIGTFTKRKRRPRLPIAITLAVWFREKDIISLFDTAKECDSYFQCLFMIALCAIVSIVYSLMAYWLFWVIWQAIYDLVDYVRGDYHA